MPELFRGTLRTSSFWSCQLRSFCGVLNPLDDLMKAAQGSANEKIMSTEEETVEFSIALGHGCSRIRWT